jgi:hypothetical protein
MWVSPVVRIGSPRPLTLKRVLLSLFVSQRRDTLACWCLEGNGGNGKARARAEIPRASLSCYKKKTENCQPPGKVFSCKKVGNCQPHGNGVQFLKKAGNCQPYAAGFRIRNHFLRIRIQWIRMEANTDPDPVDPDGGQYGSGYGSGSGSNPDPGL